MMMNIPHTKGMKLTQSDIARRADVHPSTVQRWQESGKFPEPSDWYGDDPKPLWYEPIVTPWLVEREERLAKAAAAKAAAAETKST